MAADSTIPIELLREIRDAVTKLGEKLSADLGGRIDQTNARLEKLEQKVTEGFASTNGRIDQTNSRLDKLERRVTEGFIETNTKLAALDGRVGDLGAKVDHLGDRFDHLLTGQLAQDVRDLKSRVSALEDKSSGAHEAPPAYGTEGEKK